MNIFSLFISCIFSFSVFAAKKEVVATVNGIDIHKDELIEYYKQNVLTVTNRDITIESSLEELINREISIEKAKKNKLADDPIVKRKIEDVLFHAQVSKDLEDKLKKIGTISDDAVKKYYENNKEYRTSHILFRLRAFPSPEEVKTAIDQAVEIINKLKDKPELFETFAKQYSQSSTANSAGDLGFQPPVAYTPNFFKDINGKKVGQIVGPTRTQYGVHVIKITGIKPFNEINMNTYKKILYDQKRDKIISNYFEDLRSSAKIKINKQLLK